MAADDKISIKFTLDRPARKGGGDRYKAEERDDFIIYVPQDISRSGKAIRDVLVVQFQIKGN